jgi:replicative DNA helicase
MEGENELANYVLNCIEIPDTFDHSYHDCLKSLQELYIRRELILNNFHAETALSENYDLKEVLAISQNKLTDLALLADPEIKTQKDVLLELSDKAKETLKPDFNLSDSYILTSFKELDKLIIGWQPKLYIVAARPAMGKTSFVLNSVFEAVKTGQPVLFISMEMSKEELLEKILCTELGFSSYEFKTGIWGGNTTQIEFDMKIAEILEMPLFIEDSIFTVQEAEAKLKEIKKKYGKSPIVVFDYLQLLDLPEKTDNRVQEISKISRSLKRLSLQHKAPVIALSQLSRAVEQRQNKRPMLSDLRESGQIEQDADLVAFLYREAYYNPESENKDTEFIIPKHREGSRGTILLHFNATTTKFTDKEVTNDH